MKANSRAPRIIRRVIRFLFILFVLAVNTVLIWRVFFSAAIPAEIKAITPTEELRAVYAQYGEETVLRYQEQATVSKGEASYGYFGVPKVVFIPQASQVQVIFRYNNSTLKHLQQDYSLAELPDKAQTQFDVTLVKTTDLTPDNREDNIVSENLSVTRYTATAVHTERAETSLYTYYRYVFDGVTIEDLTVGMFVDVYYLGDLNYEQKAYGTLCIYDDQSKWLPVELSSADKKALLGD